MLISQIIAANASNQEFANTHAMKPAANGGEGFNAYLARIMAADSQSRGEEDPGIPGDGETRYDYQVSPSVDDPYRATQPVHDPYSQPVISSPESQNRVSADRPESDAVPAAEGAVRHDAAQASQSESGDQITKKDGSGHVSDETSSVQKKARVKSDQSSRNSRSAVKAKAAISPKSVPVKLNSAAPSAGDDLSRQVQAAAGDTIEEAVPGDAPGVASSLNESVAEIDVVLGASNESAALQVKGVAGRDPARSVSKESKPRSSLRVSEASRTGVEPLRPDQEMTDVKKPRLSLHDLRGRNSRDEATADRGSRSVVAKEGAFSQAVASDAPVATEDSSTSLMGIRTGTLTPANTRGGDVSGSAKANPGLFTALRDSLAESVNSEIVKTAHMVVRGNDTGEIRLNLKPDTLGNVRIMLQMNEGHIAGRIIVENSSVREVFEQNLSSLIKAFSESGLETGALDVTVADSGNGNQAQSGGRRAPQAIRELDRAVPLVQMFEDDHELVDLVV